MLVSSSLLITQYLTESRAVFNNIGISSDDNTKAYTLDKILQNVIVTKIYIKWPTTDIKTMLKISPALSDSLDKSTYLTMGFVPASVSTICSSKFNYTVIRRMYAKFRMKMTTYYEKELLRFWIINFHFFFLFHFNDLIYINCTAFVCFMMFDTAADDLYKKR